MPFLPLSLAEEEWRSRKDTNYGELNGCRKTSDDCDGAVRVKLALTHEEVAQLIGCSRESVTRNLSDFKRQKLVELNGSTLLVWNKAGLETLAAV